MGLGFRKEILTCRPELQRPNVDREHLEVLPEACYQMQWGTHYLDKRLR